MTTITVNLDLDAIGSAVDRMFRNAPNSLFRNPLSEALSESFAAVGGEFRMMVAEEVRRILLSPETVATVRKAITGAMHEEAQKIGRRLARQLAMQEPAS